MNRNCGGAIKSGTEVIGSSKGLAWERPLAPWSMFFTQSPAIKTFGKEVFCSGMYLFEPTEKCVTALGNLSTAESITCQEMSCQKHRLRCCELRNLQSFMMT